MNYISNIFTLEILGKLNTESNIILIRFLIIHDNKFYTELFNPMTCESLSYENKIYLLLAFYWTIK